MFRNLFSLEQGFLYGYQAISRHCEHKVARDVVVLQVQFDKITLAQSLNKRITTVLDQVGLIGKKKGKASLNADIQKILKGAPLACSTAAP